MEAAGTQANLRHLLVGDLPALRVLPLVDLGPDAQTGLGKWTARDFKATIRSGRHMGRGRAILPPMPIPVYKNFTDPDLEAIFAYLQTIPAVKNRVPEPRPADPPAR